MSSHQPLLHNDIEADDDIASQAPPPKTNNNARVAPVVLTPTNRTDGQMATNASDAESGIAAMFRQSAHPIVLLFLYLFRTLAIVVYLLGGFIFPGNYVLSTVVVVLLLAMDFWTCRNISGRRLVGLRYWNQVDDDGESYWVFESRDPSRPANPVDSKMFWIALYAYPIGWTAILIVSTLRLSISFIPIVILAIVFNVTNAIGFTYADRDAKQRWSNVTAGGWGGLASVGGLGGQILAGAVKNQVGRVFGS